VYRISGGIQDFVSLWSRVHLVDDACADDEPPVGIAEKEIRIYEGHAEEALVLAHRGDVVNTLP